MISTTNGGQLTAGLRVAYQQYLQQGEPQALTKSALVESSRVVPPAEQSGPVVEQYALQRLIRPLFGKGEPNRPRIGTHPDFHHLAGTRLTAYAPITTLFMDLEGSTRLSLFYSLEDVYVIKNAIISAAIELIAAFDGHVHRIMGDAVMAFFGSRSRSCEDAAVDALNCASMLQYFVENGVRPLLQVQDLNDPFGIRIGIDFGPRDCVLWSAYGYPGAEEVTATSFHVDGAAKLQQTSPRNKVMIGDSLATLLDFPSHLLSVKGFQRNGSRVEEPYLRPNYKAKDGQPINYRQHVLDWKEYLRSTAIGQSQVNSGSPAPMVLTARLATGETHPTQGAYLPSSLVVRKGTWIEFQPHLTGVPRDGALVFTVENHGTECENTNDRGHSHVHAINSIQDLDIRHRRRTAYRGLHYMIVELRVKGVTVKRTRFGVYVN